MVNVDNNFVIVRGGGDLATGTIYKLVQSGFKVLVLEIASPSAIRRNVAFSEAIYEGRQTVEDMTCIRADSLEEAEKIMEEGHPAIMIDPECMSINFLKPDVVVDAIIAKKNYGTSKAMAPITIALGPGFEAGKDVDAVIETMRGHRLGRILYTGSAIPNTGIPGAIAGRTSERVIHSEHDGVIKNIAHIKDIVSIGQTIATIDDHEVTAAIDGILRGLIREGYEVTKGFKIADIDPRISELENCDTISDKARCIAGGVLEAIMHLQGRQQ